MKFPSSARHIAASLSRTTAMAAAAVGALLAAGPAQAFDVYVRAGQYNQRMPDGSTVPMWGYRVAGTQNAALNGNLTSPGAAITVPPGDTTLNVYLLNRLPVPTSFVIHGQNAVMTPVFKSNATVNAASVTSDCTPGSSLDCRVRSFTRETPPGNATAVVYTFTDVKPGTYLYQSGTLPQIQVQMGLYGMMRKDAPATATSATNAYNNVPYQQAYGLLLSEVDPAFHAAVAANVFSGSTLNYDPKFFRLHTYGTSTFAAAVDTTANPSRQPEEIDPGRPLLLRMLNAGLQSRSIVFDDGHWYVMAEDGNPYPYPREQYSVFLPAAKTSDVWITPTLWSSNQLSRTMTLFDRTLALTNNNAQAVGGMLFQMRLENNGDLPTVNVSNCPLTAIQDTAYSCTVTSNTDGVATYSLDIAPVGMTIDGTSGLITWVPTNDHAQRPADPTLTNPLRVRAYDTRNGAVGASAIVRIAVENRNDAPVAVNDAYTVRGGTLTVGALQSVSANDSDPDGDTLGAVTLVGTGPAGDTLTLNPDGTFAFTTANYAADRVASFQYQVADSFGVSSNIATATLSIKANVAPTAREDLAAMLFSPLGIIDIDVLANDYDIDNNMVASSLTVVGAPSCGGMADVVNVGGKQVVRYTLPNVRQDCTATGGTTAFTYTVSDSLGLTSAPAVVRINIQ